MRRTFQLALPNGVFGDPLVVVRPRLAARVLLCDVGDAVLLSPRTLLAAGEVLVSHAHVDHVFGLGRLLRVRLGRLERPLTLVGPAGFTRHVAAHLAGYAWNLVDAYPLELVVVEVHARHTETWRFPPSAGFEPYLDRRGPGPDEAPVIDDELLRVRARLLDHRGLACLAYRIEEHRALNVDAEALARLGLPTGPWLATVKDAVRSGAPGTTPIEIPGAGTRELGVLRRAVLREAEGDAVVYATDVSPARGTIDALTAFAEGARRLLVECHFAARDVELAARHGHLTAELAGRIARDAGVLAVSPLHVSTRYAECAQPLLDELRDAASPVPVEELATGPVLELDALESSNEATS